MISEVQKLILIGFLKDTSSEISYVLTISGTSPPLDEGDYLFYVIGGVSSLIFITVVSDFIYKRRKKFVPLTVWLGIATLY